MDAANRGFSENVAGLAGAVREYRTGVKRIDREFNDAQKRIDDSIALLQAESARQSLHSKNELSQINKLRQRSAEIERELSTIEDKINALDRKIAEVDLAMSALAREKDSLEQKIKNRLLIAEIWCFFFGDEDKERRDALLSNLDDHDKAKAKQDKARQKCEARKVELAAEESAHRRTLADIHRKIVAFESLSKDATERERTLAEKRVETENGRKKRKAAWRKSFAAEWEKASHEVRQTMFRTLRQQPAFSDWSGDLPGIAREMPDALLLGSQKISFDQFQSSIPHPILFPFTQAIVEPANDAAQLRLVHHFLLRMLQAVPAGRLELILADPLKLGQSVEPFLPLLKIKQLVPLEHALTRADEIESVLEKLMDEVEEMIQHRFKGRISNWTEFNAANPDTPLCFKVMLLFDVPEQLSDKSLWYLERLIQNGPRYGIAPIVVLDRRKIGERKYETFLASLKGSATRLDALLSVPDGLADGMTFSYQTEEWPEPKVLDAFVGTLASKYAEATRFAKTLPDLWTAFDKGATTIDGFEIPVGWMSSGESVDLTLGAGDSEHHALLAGKTGTGKSNLLHVIIHSLCEKYSPLEADLYLLDYKESTEFAVYAKPPLPHARLVATESDPEYGVTVLKHLAAEQKYRSDLFKDDEVPDFVEYRRKSKKRLPRILLIIDEFQVLFAERRDVGDEAEQLLSQLLKQGRSFGIHVLLATQTLKGINSLSIGSLLSQLGCRIALACGQEDSAMVLGANNWAAAELTSPPEGILNNTNGAKSGNVIFRIPLAESAFCREHIRQMSERAVKRGFGGKTQVFSGASLPLRPRDAELRAIRGTDEALVLGEELTFASRALKIPLLRRPGYNALFAGGDDGMREGLLSATLASLTDAKRYDEIMYFNGRGVAPNDDFLSMARTLEGRLRMFDSVDALPLKEILDNLTERRVALIVDGLDLAKALHPVQTFRTPKPGETETQANLLKNIAENGPGNGTNVFAFMGDARRGSAQCKDLLAFFELRVAFRMAEDDAGAFITGGIGKLKGVEKSHRAIFANRLTNERLWFRPYLAATEINP